MNRRIQHEQATFLDVLGRSSATDVRHTGSGTSPVSEDGRSVEPNHPQHDSIMGDSAQHAITARADTRAESSKNMGCVCQTGGSIGRFGSEDAAEGLVGVLGKTAHPHDGQIHPQESSQEPALRFRASVFVSIINATPLGPVICERQLYRQRTRAGDRFYSDRRVDLAAYTAWLIEQRHVGRRRRRAETVACGDVMRLLQAQGYRCALSGRTLTPETAALDHIVAISRGGEHCIANAQVLHRDVNRAKGVMSTEDFVALCRDVVSWADAPDRQHQPIEDTDSQQSAQVRATARQAAGSVGLPGSAERSRPGATWRERGANLARIGTDVVAVPGTAGLGKPRQAAARMEFAGSPENPAST